jgi:hypothetical protein
MQHLGEFAFGGQPVARPELTELDSPTHLVEHQLMGCDLPDRCQ